MAELDGAELEFYDGMIARMIEEGQSGKNIALKVEDISRILLKAKEIFLSQPSMLELASPIKILGDIHGCAPLPPAPRPLSFRPRTTRCRCLGRREGRAMPRMWGWSRWGGARLKRCPSQFYGLTRLPPLPPPSSAVRLYHA